MRCISVLLFITIFGGTWRLGRPTCVLESDFGFSINCAFKKSGLLRVRNLGGVKAHIGLGFSVGDELGFKESLSNTELNRRRSAQATKLQAQLIQAQQNVIKSKNTLKVRSPSPVTSIDESSDSMFQVVTPLASGAVMAPVKMSSVVSSVPPFKPIPPAEERPVAPKSSASFIGNSPVDSSGAKVFAVVAVPKQQLQSQDKHIVSRSPSITNHISMPQDSSVSLQALLAGNNLTEQTLQKQQILTRRTSANINAITTHKPIAKYNNNVGQVMNAPKEYYPVGYDKNFDDNFASRVELPETSFSCGDQKHFPGLYANEDLGCMVFHVCALTDDGLIMKSFLCPESTLFDQTILKCNWWFYIDCKNSKKLYDSNIPISKSYQLMKALTFFQSFKKSEVDKTQK